jgi:hypothetical protein
MATRDRSSDFTGVLTPALCAQLETFRRELEARAPGVKVSKSAALRAALMRAFGPETKVE